MIYKNVSSKVVIRKIMRDLRPPGDNWLDDSIEWMGEALAHIGTPAQLLQKTCVLKVVGHKALLPNDLFYLEQAAVSNSVSPAVATELDELIEKIDELNALIQSNPDDAISFNYQLRDLNARMTVLEGYYLNDSAGLQAMTYGTSTFHQSGNCKECKENQSVRKVSYIIDGDYIKTSFESGRVCLSYKAYPIDDDCYPLIPDDISFKEALFWYCYKQMLLSGYTPSMNGIDYNFADAKWRFYCTQARNQATMPSIDKYESFMDQWVRLIPNINRHAEFFENLNTRENLNRGRFAADNF